MFLLKLCVSGITSSLLYYLIVSFVATNISVILSFNVSTLKSANIDYENTFWIDTFLDLVDNQISTVSSIDTLF